MLITPASSLSIPASSLSIIECDVVVLAPGAQTGAAPDTHHSAIPRAGNWARTDDWRSILSPSPPPGWTGTRLHGTLVNTDPDWADADFLLVYK